MNLVIALSLLGRRGMLQLMNDMRTAVRQNFVFAALRCGLLDALRAPRTVAELSASLQVERMDLLEALLDLGVSTGELRLARGRYSVVGSRSLAVASADGEGPAALVEALHTYYNSVYGALPGRLRGAPNGDDLEHIGELVARASRISEPFMRSFIRAVAGTGPRRILELGCGSAGHLRTAALANPELRGVGLDLDRAVVEQAHGNLARWGLSERFQVLQGDILRPPAELVGPFDVVTLYNLVYYFPPGERGALFARLKSLLSPGGLLAIVTSAQSKGRDAITANLDVATRSMAGCWALPDVDELLAQLHGAGFAATRKSRLMPGAEYYGFTGRVGRR